MAALKHAGIANFAPDLSSQEILDAVGRKSGFLRWLHPAEMEQGDSAAVDLITTTNSSTTTFDEDDALAPAAPTISQGSFDMEEFVTVFGISGSAIRRSGVRSDRVLQANKEDALRSLISYMENWAVATKQTYAVVGQVDDDTTNWGGLDRSSVTALKSKVVAGGSATITADMLYQATEGVQDVPFMGEPSLILSSPTQLRLYKSNVAQAPAPIAGGGVANAGYASGLAGFGELPWVPVRGLLNSVVLVLDGVRGDGQKPKHFWYNWQPSSDYLGRYGATTELLSLNVQPDGSSIGNVHLVSLGLTKDEADQYAITGGAYVCAAPQSQALIEALAIS